MLTNLSHSKLRNWLKNVWVTVLRIIGSFLFIINCLVLPVSASTLSEAIASIDANAVFMRHALAPGFGDPMNFTLDECSTQRNLNDEGRLQATALGASLTESNVSFTEVKSSFWCRCVETAQLLGVGKVERFSGLNSFFQDHADRVETLTALNNYLVKLLPGKDLPLLVTHQVVISAVTGISPASGGIVLHNTQTGRSVRWQPER